MEFECYTIQEFEKDVEIIIQLIKEKGLKFRNIYGPPRGGLILGVYLSHRLDIPLLLDAEKVSQETLTQNTNLMYSIETRGEFLENLVHS